MVGLDFEVGDKILIESNLFTVKEIVSREFSDFTEDENKINYYTYDLTSGNPDITYASLDHLSDEKIIVHITKKVKSKIQNPDIWIGDKKYLITKERDEIYLDTDGQIAESKCYEVVGCKTGLSPSELHVLPDGSEIFYLTLKLNKSDIVLENDKA
jgi:hypothetical protein